MPRRDDLHKILLIGSGPIVIGQAAEFDYSGTQACRVLMDEGYEVVLVNSNPATIMTDPEVATTTYVEPLLVGPVRQVIERERPDALLPTLGGQTALNLAKALSEDGTLEHYGVELIGADYEAIDRAEDRERFRETMTAAGLRVPRSAIAHAIEEAEGAVGDIGLPFIVRPAFTLGGKGGGVVHALEDLRRVVGRGLKASPISQVLLEESVLGWGEFELEVMRDRSDNVVIICSIENIDPMGVHTGDSVCVAPQQTLTDTQYQTLRDQAIAVIRAVGVETGGSNVQSAINRHTDDIVVIEINPRVSRAIAQTNDELVALIEQPGAERCDHLREALRRGVSRREVERRTRIDPWSLDEFAELVADPQAPFAGERTCKSVDTCAAEFPAQTPYYY